MEHLFDPDTQLRLADPLPAIPFHRTELKPLRTLNNPLTDEEYQKIKSDLEKKYQNRPVILQRRLRNIKR